MKKWLRWTLGIVLVLSLLVGGFWQEENWRGRRMWEETCARLRAAGQPVELREIIPPPIPDEENVAAAPIFAELFADKETARLTLMHNGFDRPTPQPEMKPLLPEDMSHLLEWRDYFRTGLPAEVPKTDMAPADEILHYLGKWEADVTEVYAALERPKCRWPHYDLDPGGTNLPILGPVTGFSFVTRPRAVAFAGKGDEDAYVAEVIGQLRLGKLLSGDCTYLIGLLVRAFMDTRTLLSMQNCLPVLHFDDRQLLALQRQIGVIQMSDVKKTYRNEIVYDAALALKITPEQMQKTMEFMAISPFHRWPEELAKVADKAYPVLMACRPEGWKFADASMLTEFLHDEVLPCVDEVAGTILVSRMAGLKAAEERLGESAGLFSICRLGGPITTPSLLAKAARHQALAREALLWCAIERFRLKHGRLPEKLNELMPEFVEKLPCDPVNGLPLKYVRKGEQGYLLYSIGWNEKDDEGVERKKVEEGDWVWASDPRLIVNPDEEKRRTLAEMEAETAKGDAELKSKRDAEWQEAMAKRNAQFRAKEKINRSESDEAEKAAKSK